MPDVSRADFDVIVIGAGVAGLTALAELDRAGFNVLCLEARDRIGGRILTVHDANSLLPIELGAEFIHGRPPEIWEIVRAASLAVYDCTDHSIRIKNGVVQHEENAWEPVGQLIQDMKQAAEQGSDVPFARFLESSQHPAEVKEMTTSFIEGFNAARKEIIGIASLAKDACAADEIHGDRSFRFLTGYDSIPDQIFCGVENGASKLRLQSIVSEVEWRAGRVCVTVKSALTGQLTRVSARQLVVTVPLGVLQAAKDTPGYVTWRPRPDEALAAAAKLAFGQVMRVVFRFRNAFWEEREEFLEAGFLLSDDAHFPAWWTPLAVRAPMLTGWSAGPHADSLLRTPKAAIIKEAVDSLSRILAMDSERIQKEIAQVYFHDWSSDPYSCGAYSYVPAGALPARQTLARPIAETIYFAGEATELNGHSATVHGAIASGKRAACAIIATER